MAVMERTTDEGPQAGGAEHHETVIVGGGQAGLSTAYHLKKLGRECLVLDANERVGDSWRHRYDSLRLFTPAWLCRLPGGELPGHGPNAPTKDEMADYMEDYARRFALPVENGVKVDRVRREGDRYVVLAGDRRIEADHVVVATGAHREGRMPAFASELDPSIVQMHSSVYKNPSQLREGGVLIVGAGNSGADISLDVVPTHRTILSGPYRGHVPVNIDSAFARNVVVRIIFFAMTRVLTVETRMGRKVRARDLSQGDMLIRIKPKQIEAAGIERVGKTIGVQDGRPLLEDGQVLDGIANVIWCVGYRQDLSWIDLPIFGEDGTVQHERGVVTSEPGLYFVGLPWQFSRASDVIPGVGRDAAYVVETMATRTLESTTIAA
jgi:putative flavoprotein involved in K+ transport